MKRSILLIVLFSALLFGEQKLDLEIPDSLNLSDTITVETQPMKKRAYDYRYQIVSGVAMMLFFGIMLGAQDSFNPR